MRTALVGVLLLVAGCAIPAYPVVSIPLYIGAYLAFRRRK